jgi:Zn-dependent protease with chaperone function
MLIQVSKEFKKKSSSAILSIILFIIVYILLFLSAIALTLGCVAAGIFLIAAKPMFFTLMIGAGLAGFGIMISYFLIKFLFKKHINDRSSLTEIKRTDEPQLFAMIDEIVKEAGTDFPKKSILPMMLMPVFFMTQTSGVCFCPSRKT